MWQFITTLAASWVITHSALAQPQARITFRVHPLPILGATRCKAISLNDDRQIAADQIADNGFRSNIRRACRVANDRIRQLDHKHAQSANSLESRATCISPNGLVSGWTRVISGRVKGRPLAQAVVWTPQRRIPIRIKNSIQSFAYAINEHAIVIGAYEHTNGFLRAFAADAQRPDRITELGTLGGNTSRAFGLNEHGTVVGMATLRNGSRHAFLHKEGNIRDLGTLGGRISQANDVNSRDHTVGVAQTKNGHFHAFKHDEDGMHDLGTLGGSFSYAYAIYSDLVVGVSEDRHRLRRGFLHDGRHMWDLNTLVPGMKNWFITEATDINRNSEILAMARNTNGVSQPILLIPINR